VKKEVFNNLYNPDWNSFFSMIEHIGPELNDRKNRFDKADLIEAALEKATGGQLSWADDIGFDKHDKQRDIKFEVKSQGNCLFTKTGKQKRETSDVKLTNTLQQGDDKALNCTADYLILIDTKDRNSFAVAIIDFGLVVDKYSTQKSDGFSCKIPSSELTFLRTPEENTLLLNESMVKSYAESKRALQSNYVGHFFGQ